MELTYERQERIKLLDFENKTYSIATQCDLLSLNRTSLYYKAVPVSEDKVKIYNRIDEIFRTCYLSIISGVLTTSERMQELSFEGY